MHLKGPGLFRGREDKGERAVALGPGATAHPTPRGEVEPVSGTWPWPLCATHTPGAGGGDLCPVVPHLKSQHLSSFSDALRSSRPRPPAGREAQLAFGCVEWRVGVVGAAAGEAEERGGRRSRNSLQAFRKGGHGHRAP